MGEISMSGVMTPQNEGSSKESMPSYGSFSLLLLYRAPSLSRCLKIMIEEMDSRTSMKEGPCLRQHFSLVVTRIRKT